MDILVFPDGTLEWNGERYPCALGPAGVVAHKREGDGATPVGGFALRRVLYRPDRGEAPATVLAIAATRPDDGWCDDPADAAYNTQVRLPCAASHERLWRDDDIYDIVVILGHNDAPVRPGMGSAIFLHLAREDFSPTQGCVAVRREVLAKILAECNAETMLRVSLT